MTCLEMLSAIHLRHSNLSFFGLFCHSLSSSSRMDLEDVLSVERRSVESFLSKIRIHLDDIEPVPRGVAHPVTERLKDLKEEEKYGMIDRKQLDKILSKYDPSSGKPTESDNQSANSFAELLYSRPGFHQMSSTDYLIEVLNIKDRDRDSFLGGHSTYKCPPDQTLKSVRAHYQIMYMQSRSKELLDRMDQDPSGRFDNSIDQDVRNLFERDSTNGNALAVMGKNNLMRKRLNDAIKDLRAALNSNCDFIPRVKIYLSEALYRLGSDLFHKGKYQRAHELFLESLMNNPDQPEARLHYEMCLRKVQDIYKRPGDSSSEWHKRRK